MNLSHQIQKNQSKKNSTKNFDEMSAEKKVQHTTMIDKMHSKNRHLHWCIMKIAPLSLFCVARVCFWRYLCICKCITYICTLRCTKSRLFFSSHTLIYVEMEFSPFQKVNICPTCGVASSSSSSSSMTVFFIIINIPSLFCSVLFSTL